MTTNTKGKLVTADDVKLAIANKSKIRYIKKGTVYNMLGVGKAKLESGEWAEGGAFQGDDGVFYTRPYHMFEGFEIVG